MRVKSWQTFLLSLGLFFTGLALGILGQSWSEKPPLAAWIFLGFGVVSLSLSGLLWALQVQKENSKRPRNARVPSPVDLNENFQKLVRSQGNIKLMQGLNFVTETRILLSTRETFAVEAEEEWVVEHFDGCEVEIQIEGNIQHLTPGEMLRIPIWHKPRVLMVAETEDTQGLSDRAPRLILHKVSCRRPD